MYHWTGIKGLLKIQSNLIKQKPPSVSTLFRGRSVCTEQKMQKVLLDQQTEPESEPGYLTAAYAYFSYWSLLALG